MVRASRGTVLVWVSLLALAGAAAYLLPTAGADDPANGTITAPDQPPSAVADGVVWNPIFADDFAGTAVDAIRWNVADNSNYGSGNREDQCNRAGNTTVADGALQFTARRETVTGCGSNPDGGSNYYFTSGMVTTRQQFGDLRFKYRHGYAEVRMKAPRGNPYWPAFWLVGASDGSSPGWPAYGEVDVTEIYGAKPDVTESNFHRTGGNIGAQNYNVVTKDGTDSVDINPPNPFVAGGTNDWHTYGVNWTANQLQWFVDGVLVRTYNASTSADFAALGYEHSMILNLAFGGSGPSYPDHGYTGREGSGGYDDGNLVADLPGTMAVDYVKVWQRTSEPLPPPPPPPPPPPAVTLGAPAAGAVVGTGSTTFSGTCTTDLGTVRVDVTGTQDWALETPCQEGTFATDAELVDGGYSAVARQTPAETPDEPVTSESVAFTVDTVAPAVTVDAPEPGVVLGGAVPTFAGRCTNGDGDVTVTISGSTEATLTAACTDGSWTATHDLDDGLYGAVATQTDGAGHTTTSEPVGFAVDHPGPVTTDDTASIGNAWQTSEVVVTLTPTDTGAGVGPTHYTTDGSTPTTDSPQGTSIALTADGEYTIRYFSVDLFGNAEPVRTASTPIRIDRTAPETTDDATSVGDAWVTTDQLVTLTSSDAQSGGTATYFTTDGSTPTTDSPQGTKVSLSASGAYTIRYFSVDAAGNAEPVRTAGTVIRIDKAAPATTDNSASIGTSWKTTPQTVILTSNDAVSGVAATYFTTDGSTPTTASTPGTSVLLGSPGTYTVKYFSVDAAGNQEPVRTAGTVVRIDTAAPTATMAFPANGGRYNSSTWTAGCSPSSRICGTASDTGSGLAAVRVSIRRSSDNRYWNGSSWQSASYSMLASGSSSWSVPFSSSRMSNGVTYTMTLWTVDVAGNLSASTVRTITYDTSGPTTSSAGLVPANRNGWVNVATQNTPGDTFSVTFNEALNPASVAGSGTLTLSRSNGSTSYRITGLTNGLQTTGASGYLSSSSSTRTVAFPGALTLTNGDRTVTFTVTGPCSGSCSALTGTPRSGSFRFVPATTLRDVAGNGPSSSTVTSSSQVMF